MIEPAQLAGGPFWPCVGVVDAGLMKAISNLDRLPFEAQGKPFEAQGKPFESKGKQLEPAPADSLLEMNA